MAKMTLLNKQSQISEIRKKVKDGGRLTREEAVYLYRETDVLTLAGLARIRREQKVGNKLFYQINLNLNHTNACVLRCQICAFYRPLGHPEAYTLTLEEADRRIRPLLDRGLNEVHIVGGLNPKLPMTYYEELFSHIKAISPKIHIKALTAVEVDYIARLSRLSLEETLDRLRSAGLGSVPGGGAEIFDDEVRAQIAKGKMSGRRWCDVIRKVHKMKIPTNATMLYGHLETLDHRIDHLLELRALQDETGGFKAFVPLPFHPDNTPLDHLGPTQAIDDLKVIALSRLILDNFDHIKALWVYLGVKLLPVALQFGADDVGGTSISEEIVHRAGAKTPDSLPEEDIVRLAETQGLVPCLTDSSYENVVQKNLNLESTTAFQPLMNFGPRPGGCRQKEGASISLKEKVLSGERLTPEEGRALFDYDLITLGRWAQHRMRHFFPKDHQATFVVDRNVAYTNICYVDCDYCAFYRHAKDSEAYTLSDDEIFRRIDELVQIGGTQVMLQGGVNPKLPLDYYTRLMQQIKKRFPVDLHSFTSTEISFIAKLSRLSLEETLRIMKEAGLDSVPGGGAEILTDRVRDIISPKKQSAQEWLDFHETAHQQGLPTTATMMFGHVETLEERIEHMKKVREIQDRTHGFTAFISWTFSPARTRMQRIRMASGEEYLKTLAISRIFLDNITNIQTGWVTEGKKVWQMALSFGANDMGGILMQEEVVKSTGLFYKTSIEEMTHLIRGAGKTPVQRTTYYKPIKTF